MQRHQGSTSTFRSRAFGLLAVLVLAAAMPSSAMAQYWASYGRNAQHNGLAVGPSQYPQTIRWSTPVDLAPQYSNGNTGSLYTHYGSPVITSRNTVLVPVKLQAEGSFAVSAFAGGSGKTIWTFGTDYVLPSHDWIPPMGITLTTGDALVVIPGAGGSVWVRSTPEFRDRPDRAEVVLEPDDLLAEPGRVQPGHPDLHADHLRFLGQCLFRLCLERSGLTGLSEWHPQRPGPHLPYGRGLLRRGDVALRGLEHREGRL